MTDREAIESPTWLADQALAWQDAFSWPNRVDRFEVTDTWARPRSGSKFYRLRGQPDGLDVVVKLAAEWGGDGPRRVFEAMEEMDRIITDAGIDVARGVKALAWSQDPLALTTEYVESIDLVSILRQPDHPAWSDGALEGWVEAAGAVLAAYHRSQPQGWAPDEVEAHDEILGLARKVGLGSQRLDRVLEEIGPEILLRRRYGDYGPGNLQASADGNLYFLDPPIEHHTSSAHRDIANFLFETKRQLAGRGFTASEPVRGRFPDLRLRFLRGYFDTNPELVLGPADEVMLALFDVKRATALARKRFPSRPGDAAWFARLALRRRWDLHRALQGL